MLQTRRTNHFYLNYLPDRPRKENLQPLDDMPHNILSQRQSKIVERKLCRLSKT